MKSGGADYARARQCNFPRSVFPKNGRDRRFRNGACAPKPGASKIQTRSAIAPPDLRSSRFLAGPATRSLIGPAIGARAWQADLIENSPDDSVDYIDKRIWAAVKRRNRRQYNRARFQQSDNVAGVDQIPRRFARDNDQFASFLQKNIGCAQERTVARTGRDPAECRHRTGDNHHGIKSRRAADERHIEIVLAVLCDRFWNFQSAKLLFRDLFGVTAQDEMNLVRSGIDLL